MDFPKGCIYEEGLPVVDGQGTVAVDDGAVQESHCYFRETIVREAPPSWQNYPMTV